MPITLSNGNKKLTATPGCQFYGTGAKGEKRALSVRYLENSLCISIHDALPENQQSASSVYDYKVSAAEIYLRAKAVKSLAKIMKKAANYLSEDNDFDAMAVPSGSNLIEISNGEKFNLKNTITVCIYTEIGADKIAKHKEIFQFNTDKILINYDESTGSYSDQVTDTDVEYFIDTLSEFSKASNNAAAHMIRVNYAFDVNRFSQRQYEIMTKLGIGGGEGGYSKPSTSWVSKQASPSTVTRSISKSDDDLMSELDNM